MSLVGSELNLELDFDRQEGEGNGKKAVDDDAGPQLHRVVSLTTPVRIKNEDDQHEAPTPLTGIESFFLGNIAMENIPARALAQELNQRHRPLLSASSQDDYVTARSDVSDYFTLPEKEIDDDIPSIATTEKETSRELNYKEKQYPEKTETETTETKEQPKELPIEEPKEFPIDEPKELPKVTETFIMSTKTAPTATATYPTVAQVPPPAQPADVDGPMNVDPAEKVYDTVKGVWGWGKGVFIFKPFMGIAEAIAGKVVQTAGSSLDDVDHVLISKLQGLDDGILNPTISRVVKIVMGATNKTKDFVTPIILLLLKPIDFMIKNKPENPPSPAPEVTPDVEPMN